MGHQHSPPQKVNPLYLIGTKVDSKRENIMDEGNMFKENIIKEIL